MKILMVFILLVSLVSCKYKAPHQQKPNVLLIITDDQGWGDVGNHKNDAISTPAIDQLASEAIEFERFYVSPVCAPTRASLLTGRYHLATGTSWVTHRKEVMNTEEVTIAELLKANGYRTGCFGKWHNGKQYPHDPTGQGFDEFFGFKDGHLNNYFDTKLTHNLSEAQTKGYVPNIISDKAVGFMTQSSEPFFCYLAYNTPHSPFQVPDKYFEKYKAKGLDDRTAAIYGMVENIDVNVGEILEKLDQQGILENTVVVFMSDNGPNGYRYNGGFKGIKSHVDEGGVRVPFYIRYPNGKFENGMKVPVFGAHIDVFPTIAELTQSTIPDSLAIHGKSLVPLLGSNEEVWADRKFYTHQVIRKFDTIPGAVRTDQFLLTIQHTDTALYNLKKDPYQQQDISAVFPDVTEQLIKDYHQWFDKVTIDGVNAPPIEIGYAHVPVITLPAEEAELSGEIDFMGKEGWANDWTINWEDTTDSAKWYISAADIQKYRVEVVLACDSLIKPIPMEVAVGQKTYPFSIAKNYPAPLVHSPDRVKRGEVYERRWSVVECGEAVVPAGEHSVKIYPKGNVNAQLEIKELRFKKI